MTGVQQGSDVGPPGVAGAAGAAERTQTAYKVISKHVTRGGSQLADQVCAHLSFARIQEGRPRRAAGYLEETPHIPVDASHEADNHLPASFGGIL